MANAKLLPLVSDEFQLNDEERAQLLPKGKQKTIANRVYWALSYLGRAGLLTRVGRGVYEASERGRQVLQQPPDRITINFLRQFPEFRSLRPNDRYADATSDKSVITESAVVDAIATPDERIAAAKAEMDVALREEMLRLVLERPPEFFERLVVQLLQAMGYGDSNADAGLNLGRSGDGGVDGVIKEDRLGLDLIYIQAKRYTDAAVPPAQIQAFAGALNMQRANKGVFITTTRFSVAARQAASQMHGMRIVLIDGDELTRLMLTHDVGVRRDQEIVLKKIDLDFFEQDEVS
ncbi:restriction endonuclease [Roseicella aquatilis]|nr:restriction endonuclease [Roseicella aquatilis]